MRKYSNLFITLINTKLHYIIFVHTLKHFSDILVDIVFTQDIR